MRESSSEPETALWWYAFVAATFIIALGCYILFGLHFVRI